MDDEQEKLFLMFQNKRGYLNVNRFLQALTDTGLQRDDPRLSKTLKKLKQIQSEKIGKYRVDDAYGIDVELFKDVIKDNKNVILKAFSSQFIIPDFKSFCESVKTIFHECEGKLN